MRILAALAIVCLSTPALAEPEAPTAKGVVEWTDSVRATFGTRYGDGFGPVLSLHWGAMMGEPRHLGGELFRGLYTALGVAATAEAVFRRDVPSADPEEPRGTNVTPRLTIGPELRIGRARGNLERATYAYRLARPTNTVWMSFTPFVGFEETRAGEQTGTWGGRATLGFIDADSAVGDFISGIQISGDYGRRFETVDAVYGITLAFTRGF